MFWYWYLAMTDTKLHNVWIITLTSSFAINNDQSFRSLQGFTWHKHCDWHPHTSLPLWTKVPTSASTFNEAPSYSRPLMEGGHLCPMITFLVFDNDPGLTVSFRKTRRTMKWPVFYVTSILVQNLVTELDKKCVQTIKCIKYHFLYHWLVCLKNST